MIINGFQLFVAQGSGSYNESEALKYMAHPVEDIRSVYFFLIQFKHQTKLEFSTV